MNRPLKYKNYIDALHRKICIAEFHCKNLKRALNDTQEQSSELPSIPVQAYFEGVIIAVVAAIDQLAQTANSALKLGAGSGNLFESAAAGIEAHVPCFREWRERPIGLDLRKLRVRIVHYSYVKSPTADCNWQVEVANPNYQGSRGLLDYAEAIVAYAHDLGRIADKLADSLTSKSATAN